jgi:hypothetical protein
MGLYACYGNSFTALYVDYVRTSQETRLGASTAGYEDSFTALYVDDVRTSQETRVGASTVCYGDNFTFLFFTLSMAIILSDWRHPHDTKINKKRRLYYICMIN